MRAFDTLRRNGDSYVCETVINNERSTFTANAPATAYALALLDLLGKPDTIFRLIVDED